MLRRTMFGVNGFFRGKGEKGIFPKLKMPFVSFSSSGENPFPSEHFLVRTDAGLKNT